MTAAALSHLQFKQDTDFLICISKTTLELPDQELLKLQDLGLPALNSSPSVPVSLGSSLQPQDTGKPVYPHCQDSTSGISQPWVTSNKNFKLYQSTFAERS